MHLGSGGSQLRPSDIRFQEASIHIMHTKTGAPWASGDYPLFFRRMLMGVKAFLETSAVCGLQYHNKKGHVPYLRVCGVLDKYQVQSSIVWCSIAYQYSKYCVSVPCSVFSIIQERRDYKVSAKITSPEWNIIKVVTRNHFEHYKKNADFSLILTDDNICFAKFCRIQNAKYFKNLFPPRLLK